MWKFDRSDFKEAATLLVFNDIKEKDENDLELKKLIRLQFEDDVEMLKWAVDLFDKVSKLQDNLQGIPQGNSRRGFLGAVKLVSAECVTSFMILKFFYLRSPKIYRITKSLHHRQIKSQNPF